MATTNIQDSFGPKNPRDPRDVTPLNSEDKRHVFGSVFEIRGNSAWRASEMPLM